MQVARVGRVNSQLSHLKMYNRLQTEGQACVEHLQGCDLVKETVEFSNFKKVLTEMSIQSSIVNNKGVFN